MGRHGEDGLGDVLWIGHGRKQDQGEAQFLIIRKMPGMQNELGV